MHAVQRQQVLSDISSSVVPVGGYVILVHVLLGHFDRERLTAVVL